MAPPPWDDDWYEIGRFKYGLPEEMAKFDIAIENQIHNPDRKKEALKLSRKYQEVQFKMRAIDDKKSKPFFRLMLDEQKIAAALYDVAGDLEGHIGGDDEFPLKKFYKESPKRLKKKLDDENKEFEKQVDELMKKDAEVGEAGELAAARERQQVGGPGIDGPGTPKPEAEKDKKGKKHHRHRKDRYRSRNPFRRHRTRHRQEWAARSDSSGPSTDYNPTIVSVCNDPKCRCQRYKKDTSRRSGYKWIWDGWRPRKVPASKRRRH